MYCQLIFDKRAENNPWEKFAPFNKVSWGNRMATFRSKAQDSHVLQKSSLNGSSI